MWCNTITLLKATGFRQTSRMSFQKTNTYKRPLKYKSWTTAEYCVPSVPYCSSPTAVLLLRNQHFASAALPYSISIVSTVPGS